MGRAKATRAIHNYFRSISLCIIVIPLVLAFVISLYSYLELRYELCKELSSKIQVIDNTLANKINAHKDILVRVVDKIEKNELHNNPKKLFGLLGKNHKLLHEINPAHKTLVLHWIGKPFHGFHVDHLSIKPASIALKLAEKSKPDARGVYSRINHASINVLDGISYQLCSDVMSGTATLGQICIDESLYELLTPSYKDALFQVELFSLDNDSALLSRNGAFSLKKERAVQSLDGRFKITGIINHQNLVARFVRGAANHTVTILLLSFLYSLANFAAQRKAAKELNTLQQKNAAEISEAQCQAEAKLYEMKKQTEAELTAIKAQEEITCICHLALNKFRSGRESNLYRMIDITRNQLDLAISSNHMPVVVDALSRVSRRLENLHRECASALKIVEIRSEAYDVLNIFSKSIRDKKITTHCNVASVFDTVEIDIIKIKTILGSMIKESLMYSRVGSIMSLDVMFCKDKSRVCIKISLEESESFGTEVQKPDYIENSEHFPSIDEIKESIESEGGKLLHTNTLYKGRRIEIKLLLHTIQSQNNVVPLFAHNTR